MTAPTSKTGSRDGHRHHVKRGRIDGRGSIDMICMRHLSNPRNGALLGSLLITAMYLVFNLRQQSEYLEGGNLLRIRLADRDDNNPDRREITMEQWRKDFSQSCQDLLSSTTRLDTTVIDQKETLEKLLIEKLSFNPNPATVSASRDMPYQRCKNAFIDLGTNIGDSVGYFIDNAVDVCSPQWAAKYPKMKLNVDFPRPHLDVTTLEVQHRGSKPNPLFGLLQRQMADTGNSGLEAGEGGRDGVTPETFCVYGMEGNPTFTQRLTKLENFIMDMSPRPVQHVHIFTESVVTAVDGPTKLYLDKTSVEQNVRGFMVEIGSLRTVVPNDALAFIVLHSLYPYCILTPAIVLSVMVLFAVLGIKHSEQPTRCRENSK